MEFRHTKISDVILVLPDVHGDERGFFLETYHFEKYRAGGIAEPFVQDNHSKSKGATLRGLHSQVQNPQGKLVRAVEGEIFDVAVDVRPGSSTYGQWVGEVLSATNHHQLYVPPGLLHGFCVLSEAAQVEYKCTALYAPEDEITVLWNDPAIGIDWPIEKPLLSPRDRDARPLSEVAHLFHASEEKKA
jgi:dTDP-4-dehydrorhamnose 3,5-epimerase